MTADSKIGPPSVTSTGTLPWGEIARNQSGLAARSTGRATNGIRFSVSSAAARWANGQIGSLTSVSIQAQPSGPQLAASAAMGGGWSRQACSSAWRKVSTGWAPGTP